MVVGFDIYAELVGDFCPMTNPFCDVFSDFKSTLNQSLLYARPSLTATKVSARWIDDKMSLDHAVC